MHDEMHERLSINVEMMQVFFSLDGMISPPSTFIWQSIVLALPEPPSLTHRADLCEELSQFHHSVTTNIVMHAGKDQKDPNLSWIKHSFDYFGRPICRFHISRFWICRHAVVHASFL